MRRASFILAALLLACFMAAALPVAAQDPAPEPAPAETEAAAEGQITIMQVIQWGGAVGYFIIFLSFVTVVLVIVHGTALRRERLLPQNAIDHLSEMLSEQKVDEAIDYSSENGSLISRVIAGGLSRHGHPYAEMEQVMDDVAEDEAMRLEQGVGYFSLLAAIAPLSGLLGTVMGMIAAFNRIAVRGVTTPGELADPIQRALVTTCFGLIVAIPNVVAFTYFRNKLRRIMADLSVLVDEFMMPFRSVLEEPATPAPAPAVAPAGQPELDADAPLLTLKAPPSTPSPFEEAVQEPTPFDGEGVEPETKEAGGAADEEPQQPEQTEESPAPQASGEEEAPDDEKPAEGQEPTDKQSGEGKDADEDKK